MAAVLARRPSGSSTRVGGFVSMITFMLGSTASSSPG
jgi:hypothetical protein